MSDTIDNAASAFITDMGGAPSRSSSRSVSESSGKPEILFDEPGALDNPNETAGGDEPTRRPKARQEEEDEVDPEDVELDDDGNPIEPEPEDEEEEPEPEDEEDDLFKREFEVMVDGQEVKVPLREALDGYIRQKTFDQRLNILSEAADEIREEVGRIAAKRQETISAYDEVIALMKEVMPEEPDWDKLFSENPASARSLQKNYDAYKQKIDAVRTDRKKAADKLAADQAAEEVEFARTEYPKFAAAAKWKDKTEQKKDIDSMRRTALSVGYSEEEISRILDSRALIVLRKASKYDRMVASKPKPVQKNGKSTNSPGAGSVRTAPKGLNGAQRQLSRTGSVHDAIPVFQDLLRDKRR